MKNRVDFVETRSNGEIYPKQGANTRTPYEHQKEAMRCLDKIDQEPSFSTLVVLPTGGGKTYVAPEECDRQKEKDPVDRSPSNAVGPSRRILPEIRLYRGDPSHLILRLPHCLRRVQP